MTTKRKLNPEQDIYCLTSDQRVVIMPEIGLLDDLNNPDIDIEADDDDELDIKPATDF